MFILGFFSVLCTQRLPPKSGCLKRSGNLTSCGSLSTATISTFEIQQISSMPFKVSINHLLPPANKVCEGYVFIGVCLSTGGVSASGPGGCLPPPPQADTPLGKHPPEQTPPWANTPHPLAQCWDTHTPTQCMLGYTPLWWILQDTVNKRVVHIPLECIRVLFHYFKIPINLDIKINV